MPKIISHCVTWTMTWRAVHLPGAHGIAHWAAVNRPADVLIVGERGRQDLNRIPVADVV